MGDSASVNRASEELAKCIETLIFPDNIPDRNSEEQGAAMAHAAQV